MSETIRWWLVLMLVGAIPLPLCLAMFRPLADRGYALSKPFGLMMLGFTFWFLNSLHILPNSVPGILVSLLLVAGVAGACGYRERESMAAWLREHWRYIVAVEVAFLFVFLVAVYLRSLVGQINFTEQPMDLMFLNATTRAEHFPPEDPWLSGHTVAYYYFGYLIIGMVGRLAAVPTAIGYNIGLGMIAALAIAGAFCLVYNLVRMREDAIDGEATGATSAKERSPRGGGDRGATDAPTGSGSESWRPGVFGAVGGLLLVVAGNFVWVFMFASAYGFGSAGFYEWLGVQGLTANEQNASWYPSESFGFFNASRIYALNNEDFYAITEFPMFSFILGDLHPHVMALPFVLLVAGAALALFRSREPLDIVFWLQRPLWLLGMSIMLGGLAFLNTWDIATMSFLVVAAAFVGNFGRVQALKADLFVQTITFALPLLVLSLALYLPFFTSFSSQADGIGAVVTRPGITASGTRPVHALLYWVPLAVVVVPFIAVRLAAARARITSLQITVAAAVPVLVVAGWVLVYAWQRMGDDPKLAGAWGFGRQISDRGTGWFTAIAIGAILAAALLALWLELTADDDRDERQGVVFTLMLAAVAALLTLGTEFFYVGDLFNSRMNTVFKLYYQAWLLMAVAGAFSLYYLSSNWRLAVGTSRTVNWAWAGAATLALAGSALYPVGATYNRTKPYDASGQVIEMRGQLNGLAFRSPDELQAIGFLNDLAQGQKFVIVEGVGNDYDSGVARISGATGIPTVLGWRGHEDQWRGSDEPRRGRVEDVDQLYRTTDPAEMRRIVDKYGISYIYVGEYERTTYGTAGLAKFATLPVPFTAGTVQIYAAR